MQPQVPVAGTRGAIGWAEQSSDCLFLCKLILRLAKACADFSKLSLSVDTLTQPWYNGG
jgi:hypothetical protein